MQIGRKIYYEKDTGFVLIDTGEREGDSVWQKTTEQDIETYTALAERKRESFDFITLEFGQYSQDFTTASSWRVNPQTRKIEFSYPDSNQPEQPPVYQEPISEQVKQLKERQDATENALLDFLLGGM